MAQKAWMLYGSRSLDGKIFEKSVVSMASSISRIPEITFSLLDYLRWLNLAIIKYKSGSPFNARKALNLTRGFQFSNPYDRIYALLGLLDPAFTETVTVDYALRLDDTFREFTLSVLRFERNLDFLLSRGGDCFHRNERTY